MRQRRRKLRLIPASLTSFGCRRWNTNPNYRFCQGSATKLLLYMLQISLISTGLTSFDRRKFLSMFSSRASSLCDADLKRFFSSSLFFFFLSFSLCLLICSIFPFFSLFLFPFSEGFHSNEKMKEKLSPPSAYGWRFTYIETFTRVIQGNIAVIITEINFYKQPQQFLYLWSFILQ